MGSVVGWNLGHTCACVHQMFSVTYHSTFSLCHSALQTVQSKGNCGQMAFSGQPFGPHREKKKVNHHFQLHPIKTNYICVTARAASLQATVPWMSLFIMPKQHTFNMYHRSFKAASSLRYFHQLTGNSCYCNSCYHTLIWNM